MRSPLPPLHTLRAFETIARLGSFTLAAQELHVTHSAISHQMRALETSLQTSLIDRSRRELSLTVHGQQFLSVVRPVLQQLAEVSGAIRGQGTSRLRLNVLPSFAARWLLPRLGGFLAQHPGTDVEVSATQALVGLDPAGINLGIRYGTTTEEVMPNTGTGCHWRALTMPAWSLAPNWLTQSPAITRMKAATFQACSSS